MTRALRFLWALRARGVRVWVEDGRLQYDAPEGAITAEDRAQVPEVKADLLRLLTAKCACDPCSEGEEPHGDRCYCLACVHADPELDKYRKTADAGEAAAKADAEYEAEERLAIQEEACTAAELEALKAAKGATADAVETGAHEQHEPGPWNWTDPENTPEDVAILHAIERLDREEAREPSVSSRYACGSCDWWRSRHGGHLVCRRCHPPVPGAEVAEALVADVPAGAKDSA